MRDAVPRRVRRFVRRGWSALLVAGIAATTVVAAVAQPGLKASDNHLDDGQVYVVKTGASLVGVLNTQIDDLANSTTVGGTQYSLVQDADTVLVSLPKSNQIERYDPATNQVQSPLELPRGGQTSYGGGVLAVTTPDSGKAWFGPVSDMVRTDFQKVRAQLDLGAFGQVVTTASGHVIGVSVARSTVVRLAGDKVHETPLPWSLDRNAPNIRISAVGDKVVVLNITAQELWVEGTSRPVVVQGADAARLLAPVAELAVDHTNAVVATAAGLVGVGDNGTTLLSTRQSGTPITPVQVGSCLYGVNATTVSTVCQGQAPTAQVVPGATDAVSLTFQANRDHVVLNETSSGTIWLVQKGLKKITDWSHVAPAATNGTSKTTDTTRFNAASRKVKHPPTAPALSYFARVGQDTVLPVLDRCTDPDGDILVIDRVSKVGNGASLTITGGGTGLQISLPPTAQGRFTFSYTISDGTYTATGTVTVTAESADIAVADQQPFNLHPDSTLLVTARHSATRRVLNDWRDPDGDAMVLLGASVVASVGDQVDYTPDGTLTFTDVGKTVGAKQVRIVVGDGRLKREGLLNVQVSVNATPPVANGDFVTTKANTDVVISPLDNDEGSGLALTQVVPEDSGATIVPKYSEGTFTFRAPRVGDYYLEYTVSSGAVSTGLIRVRVTGDSGHDSPPVAARDVVLLPPSPARVLLDPLLNDSDPDNDVLVVQSISEDPRVSRTLTDRHLVSLAWNRMPDKPVVLTYWISDGHNPVQGTIEIVPVATVASTQPVAENDSLKVRAGYVGTADVLANDTSPLGLDLRVAKLLTNPTGGAWIENNKIKVSVPPAGGGSTFTVQYQVADTQGRTDVGFLDVTVTTADAPNDPPTPPLVEQRVLSGSTTRIQIPLDGIDPNGDAVTLRGLGSSPQNGRVLSVGDGYLMYEALPLPQGRGTDTFSYQVVDALGAVGTGEIRIGIAPQVAENHAPVAVTDTISVRPGRQVRFDLLGNDYDVDGDLLHFASSSPVTGLDFATRVLGTSAIGFTAPAQPGRYDGVYRIADSRGLSGYGQLLVEVSATAPLVAPIAHDDAVPASDVVKNDWVVVDVRKNDTDADGPTSALIVSTTAAPDVAFVDASTQQLHVKIAAVSQQVRYRVTDADGLTSDAVVSVPGRGDEVPHLKDPNLRLSVPGGQDLQVKVADVVTGSAARSVKLTSLDRVGSVGGSATPALTTIDFTAPESYVGPAALVFEVVDDVPVADHPVASWVSIPITVTRAPQGTKKGSNQQALPVNTAPQGPNPQLTIGAGEPAQQVDLSQMFSDREGDRFSFQNWHATGPTNGMDVTTDGGAFTMSAPITVKPGLSVTYAGEVVDALQASAPVRVTITTTRSTRPLATTTIDTVQAKAGQTVSVAVLANDHSNLVGHPGLTLTGQPAVTSATRGSASYSGENVLVTPPTGFAGTMTVRYTVVDATLDQSRAVDGMIQVNVIDKPGPPGVPVQVSVGDRTFTVKFSPADPHGTPVTGYQYAALGSGGQTVGGSCSANACVVTGVTNNVPYTVTVRAQNAVGWGPASGSSAAITPDVKPDPPAAPSAQYLDSRLALTWPSAQTNGSPVTNYEVAMVTGGAAGSRTTNSAQTTLTWTGLTNGTSYTFKVRAQNKAGWSDWSAVSRPQHPTGPPDPPTGVAGTDHAGSADGGWIDVSWLPPANLHGDAITCYDVYANGSLAASCLAADGTRRQSYAFKTARNGTAYVFTVAAQNRLNVPGAKSAASDPVTAFGAPEAPTDATLSAGDGCVTIQGVRVKLNGGDAVTSYWARAVASSGGTPVEDDSFTSGNSLCGLSNGTEYTVYVKAFSGSKGSDWGRVGTATPRGPLPALTYSPGVALPDQKRGLRIRGYASIADSGGTPLDEITYLYSTDGSAPSTEATPDEVFSVPTGGRPRMVQIRAVAGGNQGPITSFELAPPLEASVGSDGKVKVSLTAWIHDTSATCRMSGAGVPSQRLDGVFLSNGNGSVTFADPLGDPNASPPPSTVSATITCTGDDSGLSEQSTVSWP